MLVYFFMFTFPIYSIIPTEGEYRENPEIVCKYTKFLRNSNNL